MNKSWKLKLWKRLGKTILGHSYEEIIARKMNLNYWQRNEEKGEKEEQLILEMLGF